MRVDILVLGAGAVGTAAALQLQRRGMQVALVDRRDPGEETSFGNAGLIERSTIEPYGFPRSLPKLARYAFNNRSDMRYDLAHLPRIAPWLARYWWHSAPGRLAASAEALRPLIAASLSTHQELAELSDAQSLFRKTGWIELTQSPAAAAEAKTSVERRRAHGVTGVLLGREALAALEPALSPRVAGAVHWLDPWSVSDPGALVKAHAAAFTKLGGSLLRGDATTLRQEGGNWQVTTQGGDVTASQVVVALGPWSGAFARRLGYRVPMAIKRGYHMHYTLDDGAEIRHTILDEEGGYVLAPMARGLRLTTGAEFAPFDAPANTIQLDRAERIARRLLPSLGRRLDPAPWLGRRPCLPDMRPIVGPAPKHGGLWFSFGHAHHGLTLGPVSGLLLSQMIAGDAPMTDPTPFGIERFGSQQYRG